MWASNSASRPSSETVEFLAIAVKPLTLHQPSSGARTERPTWHGDCFGTYQQPEDGTGPCPARPEETRQWETESS